MQDDEAKLSLLRLSAEAICHDCGNLLLSQDMFSSLMRMVAKNPPLQEGDYFHVYLRDTYIAHASMMIRKHVKVGGNAVSLSGLAMGLAGSEVATVCSFEVAELNELLNRFKLSARSVEAFADRVVAHRDRRDPYAIPTYSDVDRAIEAMDHLAVVCARLVGHGVGETCKPTVQDGWLSIFRSYGIET